MSEKELAYSMIPDWRRLRKRYAALWAKEVVDGGFIAQIQNPAPAGADRSNIYKTWSGNDFLDPEKLVAAKEARRDAWQWHYDLFKYEVPSYAVNSFIGFCGAGVSFAAGTVWHEPVITSIDEAGRIAFDENNFYWRKTLDAVDFFLEYYRGKKYTGMVDFGGPGDWIASVMGAENFMLAAVKHPDKMREFALRLATECRKAFDIVYERISGSNDGMVNWMPLWSEAPMSTVQDDISVNISPALYRDVFLPALVEMASYAEKSVLHWHDACRHHLDGILAMKEIDAVQYGHDPTTGDFKMHLEYMQKIQRAGKILFISCVESKDVGFFVDNLDPRGLAMIINTADSEESELLCDMIPALTEKRLKEIEEV